MDLAPYRAYCALAAIEAVLSDPGSQVEACSSPPAALIKSVIALLVDPVPEAQPVAIRMVDALLTCQHQRATDRGQAAQYIAAIGRNIVSPQLSPAAVAAMDQIARASVATPKAPVLLAAGASGGLD